MRFSTLFDYLVNHKDSIHHIEFSSKGRLLTMKFVDNEGFSGSIDITEQLLRATHISELETFHQCEEEILLQIKNKKEGKHRMVDNPKIDQVKKGDQYTSHDEANPYYVYKHVDGITLNPREYLLDNQGQLRKFNDISHILRLLGFSTEADLNDSGYYIITKKELADEG